MDVYNIDFKPSVEKDFQKIPEKFLVNIINHIENLKENPFPRNIKKLSGVQRLYRITVGNYRVIYEVETKLKLIIIHYVRHRREVYRNL